MELEKLNGERLSLFIHYTVKVVIIIQQIVTMPIYGKEALNICPPT